MILFADNNYQDCAIDTEADSLHCYEEKLCLIQFATSDTLAIIDPLSIKDLSPLIGYLDTVTVWLHGSDFDIRMFSRSFGKVRVLFTILKQHRGCWGSENLDL